MMSTISCVHRKRLLLWKINILRSDLSEYVYENSIFYGMEASPRRAVSGEGILMTYLLTGVQQTRWVLTVQFNSLSLVRCWESCYLRLMFRLSYEMIEALKLHFEACEMAGIKYRSIMSLMWVKRALFSYGVCWLFLLSCWIVHS